MTTTVDFDFNVRVRGGQTFSSLEDVHGPIAVGDQVTAAWMETSVVFDGVVTDIDEDKRLVFMRVDWASGREEEAT